jgi:shikimate dehydrogenase
VITTIDASTRLVALLGDPVRHSLSPIMQNAAFAEAGVPGVYLALRIGAAALPEVLRAIALADGAGNVTVPHKQAAAAAVDQATDAVRRTGACNTFWSESGEVWGDNTDVAGFQAAARSLLDGASIGGARVLLLGAGGAARAVLAALEDENAAEVVIVNRTPSHAEALAAAFSSGPLAIRTAADPSRLRGERFDLAVNSTSLGLHPGDPLPLPPEIAGIGAGFDLVYSAHGTPWSRALADAGIPAVDGLEMLIGQGAAAFERWWGRPPPVQAMRQALAGLA